MYVVVGFILMVPVLVQDELAVMVLALMVHEIDIWCAWKNGSDKCAKSQGLIVGCRLDESAIT